MNHKSPDLLRPTLFAGIAFGAAAGIPFLNLLNCLCCVLVVGCGFFASWLYAGECRRGLVGFGPGSGAMVGLVAGAFYAMSSAVVETAIRLVVGGDPGVRMLLNALGNMPNLPAENRDMLDQAMQALEAAPTVPSFVFDFFTKVLVAAVFSTIGGLIGAAVFRVAPPAPMPPPGSDAPPV